MLLNLKSIRKEHQLSTAAKTGQSSRVLLSKTTQQDPQDQKYGMRKVRIIRYFHSSQPVPKEYQQVFWEVQQS